MKGYKVFYSVDIQEGAFTMTTDGGDFDSLEDALNSIQQELNKHIVSAQGKEQYHPITIIETKEDI